MTEQSSPRGMAAVADVIRRAFRPHRPPLTILDLLEPDTTPDRPARPAPSAAAATQPEREPVGV